MRFSQKFIKIYIKIEQVFRNSANGFFTISCGFCLQMYDKIQHRAIFWQSNGDISVG